MIIGKSKITYYLFPHPIPSTTNEENLPVDQEENVPREIQKKSVQRNRKLTLLPSSPSFPFEKSEFGSYKEKLYLTCLYVERAIKRLPIHVFT